MKHFYILLILILTSTACSQDTKTKKQVKTPNSPKSETKTKQVMANDEPITYPTPALENRMGLQPHPELPWHINASIYEVNVRQFSPEGTIVRVTEQLPRLRSLGVNIIWLMPIQPIGKLNRKGLLGSPYSIADYRGVNSEMGTLADVKALVKRAHELKLKVVLDWVANHTAFDHVWAKDHLDYYTLENGRQVVARDNDGNPTDWTDVADLNYNNHDMRKAMISDMKYWIDACDIDGFRCDMAGMVPLDFWKTATSTLAKTKKGLFWLAEWEEPRMHEAFKMTYAWEAHHLFNDIAQGKTGTERLQAYIEKDQQTYPPGAYRMYFTSNHDENSWQGSVVQRMGPNADAMTVLAFTLTGMPLLYNGQEVGSNRQLKFFEKDLIDWSNKKKFKIFQKLLILKQTNKALWNGEFGGRPEIFLADGPLFGFIRRKGPDAIMVLTNFGNAPATVDVDIKRSLMTDIFSRKGFEFGTPQKVTIPAHGFMVFQ